MSMFSKANLIFTELIPWCLSNSVHCILLLPLRFFSPVLNWAITYLSTIDPCSPQFVLPRHHDLSAIKPFHTSSCLLSPKFFLLFSINLILGGSAKIQEQMT